MARNRKSAKAAGTRFETAIATALAAALDDDRIERRARNGAKDRGDVSGIRVHGQRVVVETKDYGGRFNVAEWLNEVDLERGNDDALISLVVAKRRGVTDPLEQVVFMTMRDLVAILVGERVDD